MFRTFCCCLPVRLGALLLSFLELLFAGATAAVAWREVMTSGVEGTTRIALIVAGGIFSFMALVALFGFVGTLIRHRVFVAMFATMLYVLVILSIASGAFSVYSLYHDGGKAFLDACKKQTDQIDLAQAQQLVDGKTLENALHDICQGILSTARIVYIIVLAIAVIVQLYCAYIVKEYASQLKDEEMEHEMKRAKVNAYAPHAQPVVINNMYGGGKGYDSTEKMV